MIFILLEINSTPPLKNFEFSLEKKLVDSIPRSGDFFEYKFHISSIFELLNRGSIEIGFIYIYIFIRVTIKFKSIESHLLIHPSTDIE